MLSRRLVLALVSPVAAYILVALPSGELYAKASKKMAEPRKCCMAGFQGCPISREDGCVCCGSKVAATFDEYDSKKHEGSLKIDGIDGSVKFTVDVKTYPGVETALQSMTKDASGQFVLKLHMYEYNRARTKGKHQFTKWYGKRFECEGVGDDAKLADRTKEFAEGWKVSKTLVDVRMMLEDVVPEHEQEREEDKDK